MSTYTTFAATKCNYKAKNKTKKTIKDKKERKNARHKKLQHGHWAERETQSSYSST